MFTIKYTTGATDDLEDLRPFDRNKIFDAIEEQLEHEPQNESRNKKPLPDLIPPWDHGGPTWELRIGAFLVFYEVDEEANEVTIRGIRRKPPHKTTEEIL